MPEAGHLAVPGPTLSASGPGMPPATGTRGGLWRPTLTTPASGLDPRCRPHSFPPPSSPALLPPHSSPPSSAHTSFCWQFSFLIYQGFCYGFGLNCRVYLGGVQAVGFGDILGCFREVLGGCSSNFLGLLRECLGASRSILVRLLGGSSG
jgi:hypothetical protein